MKTFNSVSETEALQTEFCFVIFPVTCIEIDSKVLTDFSLQMRNLTRQSPPLKSALEGIVITPIILTPNHLTGKNSKRFHKKDNSFRIKKNIDWETWETSDEEEQQRIVELFMLDALSEVPVTVMDEEDRTRLKMQIRSIYNRTSADDQM